MQQYGWVILALAGAFFAALVSVVDKRALEHSHFTVALGIQATLLLLTLMIAMAFSGHASEITKLPLWVVGLLAAGGVSAGVSWLCGYRALQLSQVAKATPIDKLSLPIGVILAMIFLQERPGAWNWVGIVLMLIGAVLVARPA